MRDFSVSVEPTAHSEKDGYDLTIRQHHWGWSKSDLTVDQLKEVHRVLGEFLSEKGEI